MPNELERALSIHVLSEKKFISANKSFIKMVLKRRLSEQNLITKEITNYIGFFLSCLVGLDQKVTKLNKNRTIFDNERF